MVRKTMLLLVALLVSGLVQAEVSRSVLTSGIEAREPVDTLQQVDAAQEKVYFFTELRNMAGERVKHLWRHGDEVVAEVEFEVGGPRWRVYSSKNLMSDWQGNWEVQVVNGAGEVIASKTFVYGAAESEQAPAESPAEAPMETPSASPEEATEAAMPDEQEAEDAAGEIAPSADTAPAE